MKSLIYIPLLAAGLAFAACDNADSERKAALEKKADAQEDAAKATKDAADSKAHEVKAAGERKADELKKDADATREQK